MSGALPHQEGSKAFRTPQTKYLYVIISMTLVSQHDDHQIVKLPDTFLILNNPTSTDHRNLLVARRGILTVTAALVKDRLLPCAQPEKPAVTNSSFADL